MQLINNSMKSNLRFKLFVVCLALIAIPATVSAATKNVKIKRSVMVGNGIAKFIPKGYDASKIPSLAIVKEPQEQGKLPSGWKLIPEFSTTDGKANAVLRVPDGTSLYGGGEVTGPLLRNGKTIKLWNTDSGAYGVDNGTRLYQSHPWMMGVRKDGTAFGILFDTTWKAVLSCTDNKIELRSEGVPFRVFVIDRESPQAVVRGLAELTGTTPMIPRWALGYHQCRFSYQPDSRVIEVADTFRYKRIPCDAIWMDIDYMDGYRIFTFSPEKFPNPKSVNRDLHLRGFHSTWMIDPGAKVDPDYFVYKSGTENDIWVKTAKGENFHGDAWPGAAAFPDFTYPKAQKWWAGLYKDFLAQGVDGVWNDVNEPQINDTPNKTMPEDNIHRGGGDLPQGTHLQYHNVYGMLMVRSSREGMLSARPDKRPFILTRSNFLGGQRYAATWTGDNGSTWEHMKLSIPMSLTLGLSGQPISGADIGGFLFNANGDLFGNWIGFGAFYPFSRGHACAGTNNKEPWAFGPEVEKASRIAIERRYILLPYFYTLMHEAATDGMPIMRPAFFADPKDLSLRAEEQYFLVGDNLMVVPAFVEKANYPKGIWRELSLVDGDKTDKYQANLKIRGGAIIPTGKVIQNTIEESLDPLTLIVCLDENGKAQGELYWDAGDRWDFQKKQYCMQKYVAEKQGNSVVVKITGQDGLMSLKSGNMAIVKVITDNGVRQASGNLTDGIEVKL